MREKLLKVGNVTLTPMEDFTTGPKDPIIRARGPNYVEAIEVQQHVHSGIQRIGVIHVNARNGNLDYSCYPISNESRNKYRTSTSAIFDKLSDALLYFCGGLMPFHATAEEEGLLARYDRMMRAAHLGEELETDIRPGAYVVIGPSQSRLGRDEWEGRQGIVERRDGNSYHVELEDGTGVWISKFRLKRIKDRAARK